MMRILNWQNSLSNIVLIIIFSNFYRKFENKLKVNGFSNLSKNLDEVYNQIQEENTKKE